MLVCDSKVKKKYGNHTVDVLYIRPMREITSVFLFCISILFFCVSTPLFRFSFSELCAVDADINEIE
jgi:hypothetical protein